jgi:hypothetical protein
MRKVIGRLLAISAILCLATLGAHAQPSVQIISGDDIDFNVQQVSGGVYDIIVVSNDVDSTQVRIIPGS